MLPVQERLTLVLVLHLPVPTGAVLDKKTFNFDIRSRRKHAEALLFHDIFTPFPQHPGLNQPGFLRSGAVFQAMKNGLNEEEVWPNELPGLWSSRDRKGKEGSRGKPLRKKGAAAMPKVCQLPLALAPMAQTAPGQSLATLVPCQRRTEKEQEVCVEPENFYRPSCFSLSHIYTYMSFVDFFFFFLRMVQVLENMLFIVHRPFHSL